MEKVSKFVLLSILAHIAVLSLIILLSGWTIHDFRSFFKGLTENQEIDLQNQQAEENNKKSLLQDSPTKPVLNNELSKKNLAPKQKSKIEKTVSNDEPSQGNIPVSEKDVPKKKHKLSETLSETTSSDKLFQEEENVAFPEDVNDELSSDESSPKETNDELSQKNATDDELAPIETKEANDELSQENTAKGASPAKTVSNNDLFLDQNNAETQKNSALLEETNKDSLPPQVIVLKERSDRELEEINIDSQSIQELIDKEKSNVKDHQKLIPVQGNQKPIYPDQAREKGLQGSVLLIYFVDNEGLVDKIQLLQSSGHSLLDNEALRTIARYRYLPGQSGWYKHKVDFKIKGS